MIVNMNLTETHIPILNVVFKGSYTDFIPAWYSDVGATITKAMVINAFMPIIEFVMMGLMRVMMRKMDRNFTQDTYKSKKKSVY